MKLFQTGGWGRGQGEAVYARIHASTHAMLMSGNAPANTTGSDIGEYETHALP